MSCPHCTDGVVKLLVSEHPCEHCQPIHMSSSGNGPNVQNLSEDRVHPAAKRKNTADERERMLAELMKREPQLYPHQREALKQILSDRQRMIDGSRQIKAAVETDRRFSRISQESSTPGRTDYVNPEVIVCHEPHLIPTSLLRQIAANGPSHISCTYRNGELHTSQAEKVAVCCALGIPKVTVLIHFESDADRQQYKQDEFARVYGAQTYVAFDTETSGDKLKGYAARYAQIPVPRTLNALLGR